MKKVLIIVAIVFAALTASAQQKPQKVYAELVGQVNLLQTKVTIQIDFGQQRTFWKQHDQKKLVDANGKEIQFNSMVDAMNYMASIGWEFEQAYVVTSGNQNVYHWLMSKLVDEEGAATEGIKTKQDFIDSQETKPVE